MPPAEDIQRYLGASWRMMTGRPEGVRALDLSADGFWNSFFAIVVALPALGVGWVTLANEIDPLASTFGHRFAIVVMLAIIDIGTWVIPIAGLAAVAGLAGIGDRFVHYVVASNWASVILVWLMLPPALLRMVSPQSRDLAAAVSLGLFLVTLVLLWRLTNAAIDKGAGVATGVFFGMLGASLIVLFTLQGLFGLAPV